MAAPLAEAAAMAPAEAVVAPPPKPMTARIAPALPADQLMRDIAEIERARDALAAMPVMVSSSKRRTQALTLVPSRTTDPVPVVVGGVLALVMLTVFGAAAAMTKLRTVRIRGHAACGSAASHTFHSCRSPHAAQRARNVFWRMRNRVPISVSMPTSTSRPVVGQTNIKRSITSLHRRSART